MEDATKLLTDQVDDAFIRSLVNLEDEGGMFSLMSECKLVLDQFWIEVECKCMTLRLCMVSLIGGFNDNDSYIGLRLSLGIEVSKHSTSPTRWEATRFELKQTTRHDLKGSYIRTNTGSDDHEFKMNTQILVAERYGQEQGLHIRYPETAKDTTYLSKSGELCGWKDPRRRLPVAERNRMREQVSWTVIRCTTLLATQDPSKDSILISQGSIQFYRLTLRVVIIEKVQSAPARPLKQKCILETSSLGSSKVCWDTYHNVLVSTHCDNNNKIHSYRAVCFEDVFVDTENRQVWRFVGYTSDDLIFYTGKSCQGGSSYDDQANMETESPVSRRRISPQCSL
ncbi:hypothetical protein Tco_1575227 [Tanacetum coccineum]